MVNLYEVEYIHNGKKCEQKVMAGNMDAAKRKFKNKLDSTEDYNYKITNVRLIEKGIWA